MAFPSFRDMIEPLLRVLADAPDGLPSRRAQDLVADRMQLSSDDRTLRVSSGTQALFRHRINWAHDRLKRALLSSTPRRGFWQLTPKGFEMVRAQKQPLAKAELHELAKAGRDVRIETCGLAEPQPEILRKEPLRADLQLDAQPRRDRDDKRELSA
jgi:restriction system protein